MDELPLPTRIFPEGPLGKWPFEPHQEALFPTVCKLLELLHTNVSCGIAEN